MRTDREIVDQTNKLARELYHRWGFNAPEGYRFDQATHPAEVIAWELACIAQLNLTDTDVEDALQNLEGEGDD